MGGGLRRRRGGVHREMDGYARQEQAGPRKLWQVVCVCVCARAALVCVVGEGY